MRFGPNVGALVWLVLIMCALSKVPQFSLVMNIHTLNYIVCFVLFVIVKSLEPCFPKCILVPFESSLLGRVHMLCLVAFGPTMWKLWILSYFLIGKLENYIYLFLLYCANGSNIYTQLSFSYWWIKGTNTLLLDALQLDMWKYQSKCFTQQDKYWVDDNQSTCTDAPPKWHAYCIFYFIYFLTQMKQNLLPYFFTFLKRNLFLTEFLIFLKQMKRNFIA